MGTASTSLPALPCRTTAQRMPRHVRSSRRPIHPATVSASTAPGNKTLPASIADQQNRVATTTILLAVLAPPTPIHDIQSSFDTSPLAAQVVTTSGIVTGVKSNGFFIQSPENEYD